MDILTRIDERIGYIQINREERKNALTSAMYQTMADTLKAYDADDQVRVILLHGLSDMFCAGNDLNDFLQNPRTEVDSPGFVLETLRQRVFYQKYGSKPSLQKIRTKGEKGRTDLQKSFRHQNKKINPTTRINTGL